MSFISESELSQYRSRTKTFSADNIVSLNESQSIDKAKPMIFLSHKHDENTILQDVVGFLENEGINVYIDWMDPNMPAHTNTETAHKLKEKIKIADKFILVATEDAINSKWCNWELGLGDAAKYIKNIALFPINKTNQSFKGYEYLSIYPYIDFEDGSKKYNNGNYIPKGYYVKTPIKNNMLNLVPIKEWLRLK